MFRIAAFIRIESKIKLKFLLTTFILLGPMVEVTIVINNQ